MLLIGGQIAQPLDRAVEGSGHGGEIGRAQLAEAGGGQIARHAMDAQAVGAVGGDVDVDHGIVEAQQPAKGSPTGASSASSMMPSCSSDRPISRIETQHAVGIHAADHAFLEVEIGAGDVAAHGREDALHAGARIGRAADDLVRAMRRLDDADPQLVGVRMRLRLFT